LPTVAEANRFWLGVPDLRGANEMIRGDFKSVKVSDRPRHKPAN
jgi:quinoprotein glucose dehydrogenase